MHFSVLLNDVAARDLEEIYDTIDLHDSKSKADHVLVRIEKAFNKLSENPERYHPSKYSGYHSAI